MLSLARPRGVLPLAAGADDPQLQELRQRYAEAEQESLRLAAEYARLAQSEAESKPQAELDRLKEQLERSVKTAFDRRQSLQEAEVAQLHARLGSLEGRLKIRQELKDRIITRRIEDLLNPDQRWDPEAGPASGPPVPDLNRLGVATPAIRPESERRSATHPHRPAITRYTLSHSGSNRSSAATDLGPYGSMPVSWARVLVAETAK